MKRVYISGPMTDVDGFEDAFDRAEEALIKAGFSVINPANISQDESILEGVRQLVGGKSAEWVAYIFRDLVFILSCNYILLLPGWTESLGAKIEFFFAARLGLKAMFVDMEEAGEFLADHNITFNITGRLDDEKEGENEDWFKRQMGE
jgi:hypothetical protein